VRAAADLLRRRYDRKRHTVAAAVRTRSGRIFRGVNLEGIHTPCAEPVAIGAALTAGDPDLEVMVAVCRQGRTYPVLAPCGTCRQLLFDYAPRAHVLVRDGTGGVRRLRADEALPTAFSLF
jgi:cytidine deaminase